jgi:hypothetical protein
MTLCKEMLMEHLLDNIPEPNIPTQQQIATTFLQDVYGEEAPGWLTIWLWPSKYTHWLRPQNLAAAAAYAVKQAQQCDVYIGVGLRETRLPKGRGEAQDVIALPALYVDIDLKHPVHKADNLPETVEAARQLLSTIDLPPSLLIHSGHGLQAWWLLRELWHFKNDHEREEAARVNNRLQATIRAAAQLHGWHLDGTADLARVLRVPGTFNRKVPDHIVPVTILEAHPDYRYNPSDFEPYLIDINYEAGAHPTTGPRALWPNKLPHVDIHQLNVTATIKFLIVTGTHPQGQRHPSRSEAEWRVIHNLISPGYDDVVIASVLLDPINRISEKPREKGRKWVEQEIARARAKARQTAPGDRHANNGQALPDLPPPEEPPADASAPDKIHLTDRGNAQRLVQHCGDDLHYVYRWKKWLVWREGRWVLDDIGTVERCAKQVIAELYQWADTMLHHLQQQSTAGSLTDATYQHRQAQVAKIEMVLKWALKSEATPRMQAMIEQAHSEPGIAITHTQLDADPWLLNCVNGTLDLRTGRLRRPRRGDLLTKQTPVRYDPQARCPLWHAFLWRIMDGPRSDEAGDEQALLARHERAV